MRIKAIIATFIVVILSAAIAKHFWPTPVQSFPAVERKEEVKAAEKTPDEEILPTIETSQTNTPTPTATPVQTVKPTVTAVVTKTPLPTPTKYIKNSAPINQEQRMENLICDTFGEKDCQRAISLAKGTNMHLNPSFVWTPRVKGGVFTLLCSENLMKLLDVITVSGCVDKMLVAETNVTTMKMYVDLYGWPSKL